MNRKRTVGIGFFGLLTISLICLRLTDNIDLNWWWIALSFVLTVVTEDTSMPEGVKNRLEKAAGIEQ